MSAGFNFNNIQLSDRADISKVMGNFEEIEENGITHAEATRLASGAQAGWMSAADKTKLDNIESGATNVTKTSDITNDSGFISQETDPTVPAWAKQPSKPNYNWSEIYQKPTFVTQSVVTNFWYGTKAQYTALGEYDSNTLYLVQEEAD